jgi:hypothetical protein
MKRTSKLLAIPAVGGVAGAVATILLALAACPAAAQEASPATTAHEAVLKGFNPRVGDYVDLKKKLGRDLPHAKPGDRTTIDKAEKVEDTLATRIMAARKDSKPGDIFGDAAPYFKKTIEHDTQTRGIGDAYAAMQEVPAASPPTVNTLYPDKAPLATVPPLILVNLPRLPDGLEYRFMGRDLILRDQGANLIVDFVPGAVPAVKK